MIRWLRRWHHSMLWKAPKPPYNIEQLRDELTRAFERQLAQLRQSFLRYLRNWRHEERLNDLECRMSAVENRVKE